MIRKELSFIIASFLALTSPVFSQESDIVSEEEVVVNQIDCSAVNALTPIFGNVMVAENADSSIRLTMSVPRSEIEKMLTLTVAEGWYPSSLTIHGVGEDNSIVYMNITRAQNDSPRRFRVLQKLCDKDRLIWKNTEINDKDAYVTSIETNFGEDFVIKGETIKSNLIFKNLTPRIRAIGPDKENLDSERFASKENFDSSKIFTRETYYDNDTGINGQPFFEHGTYKENENIGRYMIFTLRCKW